MAGEFDPYALLQALERQRVTYIVIGGLGRVLHGSGEVTDGLDIVPSTREENLRRLGLALEDWTRAGLTGSRRFWSAIWSAAASSSSRRTRVS